MGELPLGGAALGDRTPAAGRKPEQVRKTLGGRSRSVLTA